MFDLIDFVFDNILLVIIVSIILFILLMRSKYNDWDYWTRDKKAEEDAEDSLDLLKDVVISRLTDDEAAALAKKIKKHHLK